jgi:hypothetical protein
MEESRREKEVVRVQLQATTAREARRWRNSSVSLQAEKDGHLDG